MALSHLRHRRATFLLVLLFVVEGCAHSFDATALGLEASMASPAAASAGGQPFSISKKAVFFLWGAVPISKPNLAKELAGQLTGDQRVADLKVKVRSRWSDVLLTILTVGLIVPRSVTFEGVVVNP